MSQATERFLPPQHRHAAPRHSTLRDPARPPLRSRFRRRVLGCVPSDVVGIGHHLRRTPEAETCIRFEGRGRHATLGLIGPWHISGRSNLGRNESFLTDLQDIDSRSITDDRPTTWPVFKAMVQPEGTY